VSATDTAQGELIIGNVVHGAAVNCMIVPFASPDEWYMKQFFSRGELEQFALENALIIKEKEA
jgi:hypothetical protein